MLTLVDDRTRHVELLNRLNTMRISKALCDVTILVDNKEFLAHKVILASSSDYFLSKFTENSKCDRLFIDMNKETFSLLLDYFYTSNLYVPREVVPGLFVAAKYLKVRRVVKGCSQYLAANLSLDNVMRVREAVSLNNSEQLCHSANEFIKEKMKIIMSDLRTMKLNMDIIVEAMPRKESDFHLSELVIDWLEYAIVHGNMSLADFTNDNFVLFLTKDNSLVQYNEISSHKFPSTFLKDYFNRFCSNQKNIGKRIKNITKSKERPVKKVSQQKKSDSSDNQNKTEKDVIMISGDDSHAVDASGNEDGKHETDAKTSYQLVDSQSSIDQSDSNNIFLNCEDVDATIDEDDAISNSLRSKMSSKPEEESCVIAVESTDNLENDHVFLKINCIAKVYGKVLCISLHVKSVVAILNQGINDRNNPLEMALFYGMYKNSQSNTCGSESTTSGMSSSSVSAASSLLHIDRISDCPTNDSKGDDHSNAIQQYIKNVQNKVASFSPLASLSSPRCAAGLVNVEDQLIAFGGFNRGECLSSVEVFHSDLNEWVASVPMSTCRARLVVVPVTENGNTSVYAIGGSDGYKELASVERFDLNKQCWTRVSDLMQARSYHGGCVMTSFDGGMDRCVVVGGCCGPNSLRCCETYDSTKDSWSQLSPMTMGRSQSGVASIDQRIFVVGGTNSWKCISNCEWLDLREGKWQSMPDLGSPRRGAALVAHGGKLYLFGGSDGQSSLRSFEIFDPSANQWFPSTSHMKQLRANVCGGVLFNKLMAVGGFTGKHFLDTMECIDVTDPSEWSMFVPPDWSVTDLVPANDTIPSDVFLGI